MSWRDRVAGWLTRETRAEGFTDSTVAALHAAASGSDADAAAVASVEIAAGAWGRAFMSAEVEPATRATRALTPCVLGLIGRQLIPGRRGGVRAARECGRAASWGGGVVERPGRS